MISFKGILDVVMNGANWFFRRKEEQSQDAQRIEDIELADAIKRGDSETVSAIRERRRRYPNTTLLLLIVTGLFLSGCSMMSPRKTIPLATGTAPYQLPVGDYVDTKGTQHHEDTNRWSLCEQDFFNKSSPEALNPTVPTISDKIRDITFTFIAYGGILILSLLMIWGIGYMIVNFIVRKVLEKVTPKINN